MEMKNSHQNPHQNPHQLCLRNKSDVITNGKEIVIKIDDQTMASFTGNFTGVTGLTGQSDGEVTRKITRVPGIKNKTLMLHQ